MAVQFTDELIKLQAKVGLPDSVRVYLTTFDPPVRELAQVALMGEDNELVLQVFREANVESVPMRLNTRAFFREAAAMYAASLVNEHQPKKVFVTRVSPFWGVVTPRYCNVCLASRLPPCPFPLFVSRVTTLKKRAVDSDGESDGEVDPDVRRKLLDEFAKRFGYNLPVMLQASDWLIKKVALHRRRKFLKFVSLTDIQCVADTKTPEQELSVSRDRLVVRDQTCMCRSTNSFILVCLSSLCRCTSSTLKRKYKFNVSALSFLNSIELLLFAYVTVSMNDPPGDEWVSLAVTLDCFEFVETHLFPLAHEYLAVIRGLLTFDASLNGAGRFAVSAADLARRGEWALFDCRF